MNTKILSVLAAAFLAFLPPAARPQEEPAPLPEPRTQENLVTFKLLRLTQALELTEEQTAKLFPAITRLEKEKHEILKGLNVEMRSLRDLLRSEKPDEQKILASVEAINSNRQTVRLKEEELDQFLKRTLSVVQYAKYTLFLVDFNRRLSETLDRARAYREQFMKRRNLKEPRN